MKDKEFADALGSYITDFRKTTNTSQRMFSNKCQISRTVIAELENQQHSGNILPDTLNRISIGLNLENSDHLRTVINQWIKNPEKKEIAKAEEVIVVMKKNSKVYSLYQASKDLSDKNLEMLHNIALEFKQ